MNNDIFDLTTYILPKDTIVRTDSDETLGTALSLITSSHTPIFVFRDDGNFNGLISPYQVLYKHRYPYETKVSSLAFQPPYLTLATPLYEVAQHMVALRMYILPIFDEKNNMIGVVNGREMLKRLIQESDIETYLCETIQYNAPLTTHIDSLVGEVYQAMRDKGISRMVVVDNENDVVGIVSRSDLLPVFMKPTPKQRFRKNGFRPTDWSFDVEKKYRKDEPVRTFYTKTVETIAADAPKKEIINRLIFSQQKSIVLIDKRNRPVGFLSLRDVFTALASLYPEEAVPLIMENPSAAVPKEDVEKARKYILRFMEKMQKKTALEKVQIHVEEPKYPDGQTAVFNTTLVVTPVAGVQFVSKTKRKAFIDGIQSAIEQIEKQERRSGKSKEETTYANV